MTPIRFSVKTSERGQGLTEYAIVLSLVAVAAIAATAFLGGAVKSRIAGLTGAIAGVDVAAIEEANSRAKTAASRASEAASSVNGMDIRHGGSSAEGGAEVIDEIILQ